MIFNLGDPAIFYTSDQQLLRDPARVFCVVHGNNASGDHLYPYLAVMHDILFTRLL